MSRLVLKWIENPHLAYKKTQLGYNRSIPSNDLCTINLK